MVIIPRFLFLKEVDECKILFKCDPNCKVKWDKRSNKVTVVTRRNINKGETISLDHFPDNKVIKNKDALVKRIDANRDCFECTCS